MSDPWELLSAALAYYDGSTVTYAEWATKARAALAAREKQADALQHNEVLYRGLEQKTSAIPHVYDQVGVQGQGQAEPPMSFDHPTARAALAAMERMAPPEIREFQIGWNAAVAQMKAAGNVPRDLHDRLIREAKREALKEAAQRFSAIDGEVADELRRIANEGAK